MRDVSPLKGAVILYAEDDADVRSMVSGALRRRGGEVIEADNGMQALKLLDVHLPHILLTDLQMPDLDGSGLIEAVRNRGMQFPIVVLSASALPPHVASEVAFCLAKPVDLIDVMQTLSELWHRLLGGGFPL